VFASKTILIADASTYAALDLAAVVEDHEGRVAGPVATLSEALTIIDGSDVAGAIVDCGLPDATQLIKRLARIGVPLVVQTSLPLPIALGLLADRLPVLMRPVDPLTVVATLANEIGKAALHRIR
jgi:hypothetical protein